jgi:hypothetical protein
VSTSQQIITLNRFEPARIGWRQARGMPLDCDFVFNSDDTPSPTALAIDTQYPQLVFRAKSDTSMSAYDLQIVDAISGRAHLDVPGVFFSDKRGYLAELYFRNSQGQPTRLAANGEMVLSPGGAYQTIGPLFAASLPTGPQGPAGPAGAPGAASTVPGPVGPSGQRGSMWFTGVGPPPGGTTDYVTGDMWLDQSNGDTWRFDSSLGAWARQ